MDLNHLLLRSNWAIDLDEGLKYLSMIYSDYALLQGDYAATMKERKEEANKIAFFSGDDVLMADSVDDIRSSSSSGIAVVQLTGPMFLEDGLCHYGIRTLSQTLRRLDELSSVEGVLLEVNSGGGEALAGQLMYTTVSEMKTPVGAIVHSAGSAAYLGISPARFIMTVGELGRVGSIGAMYTIDKETLRRFKEDYVMIYSDHSPQKNLETRELVDGIDTGIKKLLNKSASLFQEMVSIQRVLTYKKTDTLEGGMFFGKDAKKRGLIDSIGSYQKALKQLQKMK